MTAPLPSRQDLAPRDGASIAVFKDRKVLLVRRKGWAAQQYWDFCADLAEREVGFVVPTTWLGETVLRYCLVNPVTTPHDVAALFPPP